MKQERIFNNNILKKTKKSGIVEEALLKNLENAMLHYKEELERMQENQMQVVCAGLYNAGKSTLLNALVGKEAFATGDIPTTNANDTYSMDNIIFIDTPGLSANEQDNNTALDGYKKADTIIFVSNVQNGGLNKSELNFLKSILNIMGNENIFNENIIFVMSYAAEIEEENYDIVLKKHQENIERELGISLKKIWIYDAVRYEKGIKLNNDALVQKSGLKEFKEFLFKELAIKKEKKKVIDKERIEQSINDLKQQIISVIKLLDKSIAQNKQKEGISQDNIKKIQTLMNDNTNLLKECWSNIKSILDSECPIQEKIELSTNISYSSGRGLKSSDEVYKKATEKMAPLYDKRQRKARLAINEAISKFNKYLEFNMSDDNNYYYSVIKEIEGILMEIIEKSSLMGIIFPSNVMASIETKPNLKQLDEIRGELSNDLWEDVIQYGECYTLSFYVRQVDYDGRQESYTKKGFFGGTSYKERRVYDMDISSFYAAVREMQNDVNDNLRYNQRTVWGRVNRVITKFLDILESEWEEKLTQIKKYVNKFIEQNKNFKSSVKLKEYTELKSLWEKYLAELS